MKIKSRWLIVFAGSVILCGGSALSIAAAKEKLKTVSAVVSSHVSMILHGEIWQPKDRQGGRIYPLTVDGTSYLPVRALADALGVDIRWDGATQTIVIGEGSKQSGIRDEPDSRIHNDTHTHADEAGPATVPGKDLTKLPLGDGKYTTDGPRKGYIYTNMPPRGGGGASQAGEWINRADGTFDLTRKAVVDGSVMWNSQLDIKLAGDKRILTGNRLPEHPTGNYPIDRSDDAYRYDRNPNAIREQLFTLALPANPVAADKPSPVPPGAIGVMLTGSLIFNGLDAMGRDAVAHETQDGCYGHPEQDGSYHYHNLSACADDAYTGEHSGLVGYALDGFGIYGVYGQSGEILTTDDLDEFHGHTHRIEWDGKMANMYHYHATYEYPYTVGAFKGTPARLDMNR